MRLALVGPCYPFRGGIAHYTTLLYQALAARHELRFVTFRRQYPGWLFPGRSDRDESQASLPVPEARPLLDSLDPRTWWAAADELAAFHPDLTILPWWTPFWALPYSALLARLRSRGCGRTLFICHNVTGHERGLLHRATSRLVLRQGQAFVVHSQAEAVALRDMVPGAKLRCTPHPTYAGLSVGAVGRDEARAKLGLSGDTLLFFGLVRPYKGLADLLRALPVVRARRPATLLVVGEFWEPMADYQAQAEEYGVADAVRFVDRYVPNEEIPLYFAAADLVVLPYRSVTGSGVVQLALGCGRPVVATRLGGLAESIVDGRTGFLAQPGDAEALAAAILRFLELSPEERAAFAERIAGESERFSWQGLVRNIEELAAEVGAG